MTSARRGEIEAGTLVILPGCSSPSHEKYKPVYKLLYEQAILRGWNPRLVYYPGQALEDGTSMGALSPSAAVDHVLQLLETLRTKNQSYRLLGLSFGCFVALASALQLGDRSGLMKITLWGPVPHWLNWSSFGRGDMSLLLGKGTTFVPHAEFYKELVPVEYLLPQLESAASVCVGTDDRYVPIEFVHCLEHFCRETGRRNVSFTVVQGCAHNVSQTADQNWQAYIDAVFS